MSWGEAFRLTQVLTTDPASHLAAAVSGWDGPVTREALVLMDLFDLTHLAAWGQSRGKGSRPKPYRRPWALQARHKTGPAKELTQAEIVAALQFAGHTAPLPELN